MENNTVSVSDIIDMPLKKIWQKYKNLDSDLLKKKFLAPKFISCNSILFLGINPSYSGSTSENKNSETVSYYELSNDSNELTYFNKFSKIAQDSDIHWAHLDLLFFRETNQKKVNELINKQPDGVSFILDKLLLSKQLIELSKPKLIIASNTKVRQLLGFDKDLEKGTNAWMDYSFCFDKIIGTHRIKTDCELFNVPVFFTSMLSGQRALDRGSFERLQWHVNFVLGKIK